MPLVPILKSNNKKVAFVQEGPVWYVNDFDIKDQFNLYNQIADVDYIFAHNDLDMLWYKGLFPTINLAVMPTLMIEDSVSDIKPQPDEKAMIGGNFCRWYGGFQSYVVASEFLCPISVPSMHAKRKNEDQVPNLTHLPYMNWVQWMRTLSTYKYAVHLMPTVAAGTFSLNCAYFGIPCIGNINVDTQRICFPDLSVAPENVRDARNMALKLKNDRGFYQMVSEHAKKMYHDMFGIDRYKQRLQKELQ
jgi:hypothetical protein